MQLVPRLKIGKFPITKYKSYDCSNSSAGPVVEAFFCSYPIKQEAIYFEGERISHVTGVIGNSEKAGVLYLQFSEQLAQTDGNEILSLFKTIRQTFNDCLNLR